MGIIYNISPPHSGITLLITCLHCLSPSLSPSFPLPSSSSSSLTPYYWPPLPSSSSSSSSLTPYDCPPLPSSSLTPCYCLPLPSSSLTPYDCPPLTSSSSLTPCYCLPLPSSSSSSSSSLTPYYCLPLSSSLTPYYCLPLSSSSSSPILAMCILFFYLFYSTPFSDPGNLEIYWFQLLKLFRVNVCCTERHCSSLLWDYICLRHFTRMKQTTPEVQQTFQS